MSTSLLGLELQDVASLTARDIRKKWGPWVIIVSSGTSIHCGPTGYQAVPVHTLNRMVSGSSKESGN